MDNHEHHQENAKREALEECPLCLRKVTKAEIPNSTWPGLCNRCVSNFYAYGTD